MFDIGWSELLIIAIVAIVVVGPRELPKMLRAFGATVGKMRRMANEFQDQFKEAMREAELEEARKEVEKLAANNPLTQMRDDIRNEVRDISEQARFDPNAAMTPPQTDFAAPSPEAAAAPAPSALAPPAIEEAEAAPAPPPQPAASREPASTGVL